MVPAIAGLSVIALPLGVLAVLQAPMSRAFTEFCGARYRADFWVRVLDAAMLAGPVTCALFAVSLAGRGDFRLAVALMRGTSLGLAGGMVVIAVVALVFTARMAAGILPPPVTRQDER